MDRKSLAAHLGAWHTAVILDPAQQHAAARAEIRRAASVRDVLMTRAFGHLLARLSGQDGSRPPAWQIEMLARCVLISARVPAVAFRGVSLGAVMGQAVDGRSAVSEMRAKILFQSNHAGEAADRLRALLGVLNTRLGSRFKICPWDLIAAMSDWNARKSVWAMDYHMTSCLTHESLRSAAKTESYPEAQDA